MEEGANGGRRKWRKAQVEEGAAGRRRGVRASDFIRERKRKRSIKWKKAQGTKRKRGKCKRASREQEHRRRAGAWAKKAAA